MTTEEIKRRAEKYEYLKDFRYNDCYAYNLARKQGIIEELGLKRTNDHGFTYTRCRMIAASCNTRSEFFRKNKTAYRVSLKNGWLDGFKWMPKGCKRKPRGYWTEERTLKVIKHCENITDLRKKYLGAETAARRYGFLKLIKEKK